MTTLFITLFVISVLIIVFLCFIIYRQMQQLKQYELFFFDFSEKIKDFTLFLNSILKMNILYFDDTIFELVEKIKLMKNDLLNIIKTNVSLFENVDLTEIEIDENLEIDEEQKEVLGITKNYGRTK